MHKNRLLHRDIKLDNMMFSSDRTSNIVVFDFDMALMTWRDDKPRNLTGKNEVDTIATF